MTRRTISLVTLSIVAALRLSAQSIHEGLPAAIEDNSFLIEEAYNQEDRVVQHISTAMLSRDPNAEFEFSFTQEWPLDSQRHQLSYTIPLSLISSNHSTGAGNILLNYRYQLTGHDGWAAFAPRVSLIIPTSVAGYQEKPGAAGVQFNLPASKRFTRSLVIHANAGLTFLPSIGTAGTATSSVSTTSLFAGASVILLASEQSNVMFEGLLLNDESVSGISTKRTTILVVNPGYRHAFDIGDLQIVPGISVPITFSGGSSSASLFIYLSFEHPF